MKRADRRNATVSGADNYALSTIWLSWLLNVALKHLRPSPMARGDLHHAAQWRAHAAGLESSLEREAWDSAWFDDGSAANDECQIDSIAQSWAVISGGGPHPRRACDGAGRAEAVPRGTSIGAAVRATVRQDTTGARVYQRLSARVRENGGQYTHTAMWSVIAFAALGEGDKAGTLFSPLNSINHARRPRTLQGGTLSGRRRRLLDTTCGARRLNPVHGIGRLEATRRHRKFHRAADAGCAFSSRSLYPQGLVQLPAAHRYESSQYEVLVEKPDHVSSGIASALVDGIAIDHRPLCLPLVDDGAAHQVLVRPG